MTKPTRKAAKKARRRVAKKASKSAPGRRSLILIGAAFVGVAAALIAKRAFSGDGDGEVQPPAVTDTQPPQGVQPPIPEEQASG